MTAALRRSPLSLVFVVMAMIAAACGTDSSVTNVTPTTPGTSSSGITILVDSASSLQVGVVATTIHVTVHTTVAGGAPAANQVVTWAVTADSGTVAQATTTTDATGKSTNDWTLGKKAGANTLSAAITGASITITATGSAGPLTSLIKVSPDSQSIVASASAALVVRAIDQYSNPISGVVVTWGANGGLLTPATPTTTGSTGNAQVTFTTSATAAKYAITAATSGVPSVTFTLTGM